MTPRDFVTHRDGQRYRREGEAVIVVRGTVIIRCPWDWETDGPSRVQPPSGHMEDALSSIFASRALRFGEIPFGDLVLWASRTANVFSLDCQQILGETFNRILVREALQFFIEDRDLVASTPLVLSLVETPNQGGVLKIHTRENPGYGLYLMRVQGIDPGGDLVPFTRVWDA